MIDTRLMLRIATNMAYEGDNPLLATLAPDSVFVLFPEKWACGPATFDYLVDRLLEDHGLEPEERAKLVDRAVDGKAMLSYRDIEVVRSKDVPENRLWPS